jgi:flagellar basal-body rod protein FlgG
VTGLFTQGTLTPTGQQFDLAIDGQGFFAVTLLDGSTGYTRAGGLTLNANRQLVTTDGFLLAGGITVPADASSVSVATDGTVTANTPSGPQAIGQLTLTDFSNPAGLVRAGNTTFAAGPNAGTATTGAPGSGGLGTVRQGFLESSNVDLSTELVNLIVAQRAFQINAQALTVENETLQATTALIP